MKNRRPLIIAATALAIGALAFWLSPKSKNSANSDTQKALEQFSRSTGFTQKAMTAMEAYFSIKDALVDYDTAVARNKAAVFIQLLDSLPLEEVKKDSGSIYETALITREDIKSNINSMIQQTDITEMRKDFKVATELMYPGFLKLIKYEGAMVYLQQCPMAFEDSVPANWLSRNREILNPYLGKFHPKYQSGMLHCGEVLDSIGIK